MGITFKPPRPTVDMTFNLPSMPALLPNRRWFTAVGDCAVQAARHADLQERAVVMPKAEQAWRELTPFYRAWLSLCGYTAMSYYEERA